MSLVLGPSKALVQKRADARDYSAKMIAPIVEGAVTYLRLQKPTEHETLPLLLNYLHAKAQGHELLPDEGRHQLPTPDHTTLSSDLLAPIIAHLVKEMPNEGPDLIKAFIAKVEEAMKNKNPAAAAAAAAAKE